MKPHVETQSITMVVHGADEDLQEVLETFVNELVSECEDIQAKKADEYEWERAKINNKDGLGFRPPEKCKKQP